MKGDNHKAEFDSQDGRRVLLRPLRMKDIGSCLLFANTLVKERRTNLDLGIISFDRRVTRKEEMKFLRTIVRDRSKGDAVNVAAFIGDKLVGNCDIRRRKAKDERHCGVFGIVILDGHRGIGIGERMMAEALREARALGIWLVELTVFASNLPAIQLYKKMGFRRAGFVPGKIIRGDRHYDEVMMYADLRGSDKSTKNRRRKS